MGSNNPKELQFLGKYIIKGELLLLSGLRIGGTSSGFEIGGLDNPVIKDPITEMPYIPGSSLKGKMRSLLEWAHGLLKPEAEMKQDGTKIWKADPCTDPKEDVAVVFGVPAEKHPEYGPGPTRLTIQDAFPKGFSPGDNKWRETSQIQEWEKNLGEGIFTEIKAENALDRLTSAANPRTMERVPAGSRFNFRFIYDVYHPDDIKNLKLVFQGLALLEDGFLGGSGTRGSGRVKVENLLIEERNRSHYVGGEDKDLPLPKVSGLEKSLTLEELTSKFEEFFKIQG